MATMSTKPRRDPPDQSRAVTLPANVSLPPEQVQSDVPVAGKAQLPLHAEDHPVLAVTPELVPIQETVPPKVPQPGTAKGGDVPLHERDFNDEL